MPLLLLIFLGLYGWIEFEAFIAIGNAVGGLVTFLGIFVTAFIGITLVKFQGISVIQQWKSGVSEGKINTSMLASSVSLVLGAVLMLLPGYVTDFIGLLCFVPGLRVMIGESLLNQLGASVYSSKLFSGLSAQFDSTDGHSSYNQDHTGPKRHSSSFQQQPLEGEVIEGQYKSRDDPQK